MKRSNLKRILSKLWLLVFLFCHIGLLAQSDLAQRSIKVSVSQPINFGSFCLLGNMGGTITVLCDGTRTSTGSIILLSNAPNATPAIYELKLEKGRKISITFNPKTNLTNNKGSKLWLEIGPSDKGMNGTSFSADSEVHSITQIRIGGILHIPGYATAGIYSGNFDVTFNNESFMK